MRGLLKTKLLSHEQEKAFFLNKQWDEIIIAHARMAIKLAHFYKKYNFPFSDLFQEGMIGLIKATQKFKTDYDVRFSTYAKWWIKASIQQFILNNWSIVCSSSRHKKVLFTKMKTNLTNIQHYDKNPNLCPSDISIDQPVKDGSDKTMQDILVDKGPSPEETTFVLFSQSIQKKHLCQALNALNSVERNILSKRYLHDPQKSYSEIAVELEVSILRIQSTERRALRKMQIFLKKRRLLF